MTTQIVRILDFFTYHKNAKELESKWQWIVIDSIEVFEKLNFFGIQSGTDRQIGFSPFSLIPAKAFIVDVHLFDYIAFWQTQKKYYKIVAFLPQRPFIMECIICIL